MSAACPECGTPVDGVEACFALFAENSARVYSDPAYGAVNFLTTDAHCLQHPEQHGYKNNAFHLIRLCWVLEFGGDPRLGSGPRWLQKQFDGKIEVPEIAPPPPGQRGAVTVADVRAAVSPEQHAARARDWGAAVWAAYGAHHAWARARVRQWAEGRAAIAPGPRRG